VARTAEVVDGAASGTVQRPGRPGTQWPWLIVLVGLGALKGKAVTELFHYRTALTVVLAVGLASSLLRGSPVAMAVLGAPLLAVVLDPHSVVLGIAVGVGAFVLLLSVFAAIGTLLGVVQDRDRPDATRARRRGH
jgi:hypothetical protein